MILFKPLEIHLELADLLVQFRLQLLPGPLLSRPATGKKLGQLLHQMVSPQPDLAGMDAELARNSDLIKVLDQTAGHMSTNVFQSLFLASPCFS